MWDDWRGLSEGLGRQAAEKKAAWLVVLPVLVAVVAVVVLVAAILTEGR